MKHIKTIILVSILVTACGCSLNAEKKPNNIEEEIQDASQRKNSLFSKNNQIDDKRFALSSAGKNVLRNFLDEIRLPFILDLRSTTGIATVNKEICNLIIQRYKQKIKIGEKEFGEICKWNLIGDNNYLNPPITISLSELDNQYLLLLIDEHGLGAPMLFTYLYKIKEAKVYEFSRPSMGNARIYYASGKLYFVNLANFLELTYDVDLNQIIPLERDL